MQIAHPASRRRAVAFALVASLWATVAGAQAPTLTASRGNVVPGSSVALTVTGLPGEHFAIVGSTVDYGGTYAGLNLAVGADYVTVAQGVLDGMGVAVVPFSPPFLGSVIDRVYLQAATSMSPVFAPAALSPGLVLRNNDLVSGLTGTVGPVGPAGPVGASGPSGPEGPAGPQGAPGTMGAAGPVGPQGIPGLAGTQGIQGTAGAQGIPGVAGTAGTAGAAGPQGLPGVGFRTDCGGNNVAVWNVNLASWECSTALSVLTTTVQTLANGLAVFQVDAYLNSLPISQAHPIGTSLAVYSTLTGTGCSFRNGTLILDVYGSDHPNYASGMVFAYTAGGGGGSFYSVNIPVTMAQLLARCATGQAYVVAK